MLSRQMLGGDMVAFIFLEAATEAGAAASLDVRDTARPEPRMRVEVRGGVGIRRDRLAADGARIDARGAALSDFVLQGAWFSSKAPVGFAGRVEVNRFSLRGDEGDAGHVSATGLEVLGGMAGRLAARWRMVLEGQVGYGFLQVPLARVPSGELLTVTGAQLRAHGPFAGVLLAVAATEHLALEASGRVIPLTFGGRLQGNDVSVQRLAVGIGASVGRIEVRDFALAALVGYEVGNTVADAASVELKQLRHQITVGLRASPVARRPVTPVVSIAPPARGRILGVVRAEAGPGSPGALLAGVTVAAADGPTTLTGADGRFVLEGLAGGLVKLSVSKEAFVSAAEVVSLSDGGEATLQITLRRAEAPAPAVVMGLVRGDDGTPVAARVRLIEPGLEAQADAAGHFRFEVPPGRYTLTIEAPGFVTQRKSVVAGAGEQNIYDVDLQSQK